MHMKTMYHTGDGSMCDISPLCYSFILLLFTKRQKLFLEVRRRIVGGVAV